MDEIELTFLPEYLPHDVLLAPSRVYLDVYLPAKERHPVLRVRQKGENYEMTKKEQVNKDDASHQRETTIPLAYEEWQDLVTLPGKRLEKIRYEYTADGHNFEIDIFSGQLAGLVLVDIEFASHHEKNSFLPPDWLLADVTQEEFVAGGMLCGKTYKDIEQYLAKYGYDKIFI